MPARAASHGRAEPPRLTSAPARPLGMGTPVRHVASSARSSRDGDSAWRRRSRRQPEDSSTDLYRTPPEVPSREVSTDRGPFPRDPLAGVLGLGPDDALPPLLGGGPLQAPYFADGYDQWDLEDFTDHHGHEQQREEEEGGESRSWKREASPARVEDTVIGKGFSEFLKRGVAQAAPRQELERAEMVPSKDGGFIATIQKGFEGIFGHLATSKEEVLKKRGPMPAPEYEAVPGDDIDQRVEHFARQLPVHLGDSLKIYRSAKGEYKIGTDEVNLAWQTKVLPPSGHNPSGSVMKEVFVFTASKENVDDQAHEVPCEPLPFYLRHSANIAYDLQYGSKVTKVPECSRLSFAEETGTLLKDSDAESKFNAMNVAIQQAKKREQAAMEWRKRNAGAGGGSSPKSSSDCGTPEARRRFSPRASGLEEQQWDADLAAPPYPSRYAQDDALAAVAPPPPGPAQPQQQQQQQPQQPQPQQPQQQQMHQPPPPPPPPPLPPPSSVLAAVAAAGAAATPPVGGVGHAPIRGLNPPQLHWPPLRPAPNLQKPMLFNGGLPAPQHGSAPFVA